MTGPSLRDAPHLLLDALDKGQDLLRAELRLARAEVTQGLEQMGKGAALYAAAGLFGLTALHALAATAVLGLMALGLGALASAAIVTLVLLAVAAILALTARSRLKNASLTPKRSLRGLRADLTTAKEAAHV
ncbi:phage holin family protein [Tropicibacter naphthalenivorans]|uniref:Phage holin family protein n=1 Tax=Tropicibacter naphthalenivorans TaxID=441103 RepID=A0A0P1G1H4_9RHOB|nr:phage holin family protein [Tropicibacter naphthalenivorans]CUH75658.1 hypothetical protein TRN7648_00550 [Tropicibacter naphthalenivorans]SMC42968.1 Putative Holin-X, holin superfamily III [Tropicibacter naphthalenivorans]